MGDGEISDISTNLRACVNYRKKMDGQKDLKTFNLIMFGIIYAIIMYLIYGMAVQLLFFVLFTTLNYQIHNVSEDPKIVLENYEDGEKDVQGDCLVGSHVLSTNVPSAVVKSTDKTSVSEPCKEDLTRDPTSVFFPAAQPFVNGPEEVSDEVLSKLPATLRDENLLKHVSDDEMYDSDSDKLPTMLSDEELLKDGSGSDDSSSNGMLPHESEFCGIPPDDNLSSEPDDQELEDDEGYLSDLCGLGEEFHDEMAPIPSSVMKENLKKELAGKTTTFTHRYSHNGIVYEDVYRVTWSDVPRWGDASSSLKLHYSNTIPQFKGMREQDISILAWSNSRGRWLEEDDELEDVVDIYIYALFRNDD